MLKRVNIRQFSRYLYRCLDDLPIIVFNKKTGENLFMVFNPGKESMAKYMPKVLKNPTDQVVEFRCGGAVYQFKPGEIKPLDGYVAYHALSKVNTGLQEYDVPKEEKPEPKPEAKPVIPSKSPDDMGWIELQRAAKKAKVYEFGMTKLELISALKQIMNE